MREDSMEEVGSSDSVHLIFVDLSKSTERLGEEKCCSSLRQMEKLKENTLTVLEEFLSKLFCRNPYRRPSTLAVGGTSRLGVPGLEQKSSSDPELGGRATIIGNEGGFPPGLTVDELAQYSRRRPPCHLRPQDNLRPEQGTLKSIKSEYRRRYIGHHQDTCEDQPMRRERRHRLNGELKLEGDTYLQAEYYDSFINFPRQRPKVVRPRSHINPDNFHELPMDLLTEKNEKYIAFESARRAELARVPTTLKNEGEMLVKESEFHAQYVPHEGAKRADLARRSTSLRMEGPFDLTTEKMEKFIAFLEAHRADLVRRPTNLRLEGEMCTLTEKGEKYIEFPLARRAELKKRLTNLRLEGEMEKTTENTANFIEFLGFKRAELLRRSTNLHLEGDHEYFPEYSDRFVDFPRERPVLRRQQSHLKQEGGFDTETEQNANYIEFPRDRPIIRKQQSSLKPEGDIETETEQNANYINFPRERPVLKRQGTNLKPEGDMDLTTEQSLQYVDLLSKVDRSQLAKQPSNLHLEGDIEIHPEYRDNYINFPRERPHLHKQMTSLKSEGEMETMTEKEARYIPFSAQERAELARRSTSLRLEGDFNTSPEYKESYRDFPRERPVSRRPEGQLQHNSSSSIIVTEDHNMRPRRPGRPAECNLRSEIRLEPLQAASQPDFSRPHHRRAESERRHRPEQVSEQPRRFIDFTVRENRWGRRTDIPASASVATAVSSPHISRRGRGKPPPRTADSSRFYPVMESADLKPRKEKNVTFDLGNERPKTSPLDTQDAAESSCGGGESEELSSSPTFRLHVMNVDDACDEGDDFIRRRRRGRRRQSSSRNISPGVSLAIIPSRQPSPTIRQSAAPSPSPQMQRLVESNNNPAFVVLDDLNNNSSNSNNNNNNNNIAARKQSSTAIPRSKFLDIPPEPACNRRRSGLDWMPPWHDAPTSI